MASTTPQACSFEAARCPLSRLLHSFFNPSSLQLPPGRFLLAGGVRSRDVNDFCEDHPDVVILSCSILSCQKLLQSLPLQRLRRSTLFADVLSVKVFPKALLLQVWSRQAPRSCVLDRVRCQYTTCVLWVQGLVFRQPQMKPGLTAWNPTLPSVILHTRGCRRKVTVGTRFAFMERMKAPGVDQCRHIHLCGTCFVLVAAPSKREEPPGKPSQRRPQLESLQCCGPHTPCAGTAPRVRHCVHASHVWAGERQRVVGGSALCVRESAPQGGASQGRAMRQIPQHLPKRGEPAPPASASSKRR